MVGGIISSQLCLKRLEATIGKRRTQWLCAFALVLQVAALGSCSSPDQAPGPAARPSTTTSVTPLPPVAEFTTLLPRIEQLSTQLKTCPSGEADALADSGCRKSLQLIAPLGRDLRAEILARPDGQRYTTVLEVIAKLEEVDQGLIDKQCYTGGYINQDPLYTVYCTTAHQLLRAYFATLIALVKAP